MAQTVVFVPKNTSDLSTVGIAVSNLVRFMEGSYTVSTGGNLSALAGLSEVFVGIAASPNFPATNPLRTAVNAGTPNTFKHAGGGTMYINADGSGTDSITTFQGVGTATCYFVTGGTLTNFEIGSGTYWVSADVAVTTMWVMGGETTLVYSATRMTTLNMGGGNVTSGRGISTTLNLGGGRLRIRRENTTSTLPNCSGAGTCNLFGGMLDYAGGKFFQSGTINVLGGVLNMSDVPISISAGTLNITAQSRKLSTLESKIPGVVITFAAINEKIGEAAANQFFGFTMGAPGGSVAAATA